MSEEHYFLELNEIPLYNFDKCLNGKYGYTRRSWSVGNDEKDFEAWTSIYDQYIAKFGIGRDYSIFLDKMEELTLINCDFVMTGNNFLLNKKRLLEAELKEYTEKEGVGLTQQIVVVTKWMGSRVNPRETSAEEFFTMLEMIKKEQEKNGKKSSK